MKNIDYKGFFINIASDTFLDLSVHDYTKEQKEKLIFAIKNYKDETFTFDENKIIKFYGDLSKKINELNDNIIFIYKDSSKDNQNKSFGFLVLYNNSILDIVTAFPDDFSEVDEEDRDTIFNVYFLLGQDNDFDEFFSTNQVKEIIGPEVYDKFINHFLKEENLLVKNSIYRIY